MFQTGCILPDLCNNCFVSCSYHSCFWLTEQELMAVPYSSCELSAGMTRETMGILSAVLNSFSSVSQTFTWLKPLALKMYLENFLPP